ncbi:redoxin domain-containing protein [Niveispirillum sp.]|uniref:redoxin domain-containing protein n=1 Tax=Niveispirillum sp. TaxID=1917217 RepID=UPI001B7B4C03|nr:redoxin domain-containing protein [Niveispirillum sp.]MBP7340225.1 redoxin domain-containing protein [Niveispirillum sp.]
MSLRLTRRTFLNSTAAVAGAGIAAPLLSLPALAAPAAAIVGKAAPAFTGRTVDGAAISLADYKGKLVILEWTNHGCPFVRKHYDSGNMQAVQAEAVAAGAVWLTVISSAPGEQGHVTPADAKARAASEKWAASTTILDPSGDIGRAYAAKTTPHMFIIGTDGILLYDGAIDDKPTANKADIPGSKNYVRAALADIAAGRPVAVSSSRAYGCAVKYAKSSA